MLWLPTVYGIHVMFMDEVAYYEMRLHVMDEAVTYGQEGAWWKSISILEPYRWDETKPFNDLYTYCLAKNDIAKHKDWSTIPDWFGVDNLPPAVREDAAQIKVYVTGYQQYMVAKKKFENLQNMKALIGYKELQDKELKAYTDDQVPPEYREDAIAMRQAVGQAIIENQPKIDAINAEWRQKREASEAAAKADARRMASRPKTQKAKDEEDYSRGYDDGRFSAAEGIWEDYDENESEAYIRGYQDGQGEAREEMEDEKHRSQQ